jgi:broad specificity phosphatase PhoE
VRRLVLVRHASTRATRDACFGTQDGLDARGRAAAAALQGRLPKASEALASPCPSASETASLAGYAPVRIEPALADCDYGAWSGRALADVERDDPAGVASWLTEPDAAPHGGESLRALLARVASWLDREADRDGLVVAAVPASVVKAAVVHALGAPAAAFWRLDVAPAAVTELHGRAGRWTVTRVNDAVGVTCSPPRHVQVSPVQPSRS